MAKAIQDLIIVDQLLTEILTSIAVGHAALAAQSASPLGSLAVKSAEVNVSFDFSVEAQQSKSGFTLGVRPTFPFGFATDINQTNQQSSITVSNRATVTLQIVNVAPLIPEATPIEQPVVPPPKVKPFDPTHAIDILEKYLRAHEGYFSRATISGFNQAQAEFRNGNETRARQLFGPVLVEIRAAVKSADATLDADTIEALDQLVVWAGAANQAARKLSARNRNDLENLLKMSRDLDIEGKSKETFVAGIQAALSSNSRAESQFHLARALEEIRPSLTGKLLPVKFFDSLERLEALKILNSPDLAWRERLVKPLTALVALVNSLEIPAKTKTNFERQCQKAADSGSELEAGSRIYQAVQDLKRRTRGTKLPPEVQQVLEGFGSKP